MIFYELAFCRLVYDKLRESRRIANAAREHVRRGILVGTNDTHYFEFGSATLVVVESGKLGFVFGNVLVSAVGCLCVEFVVKQHFVAQVFDSLVRPLFLRAFFYGSTVLGGFDYGFDFGAGF